MCVDYLDRNHACPKKNDPTLFIDLIVDDCHGSEEFLFMDSFSSYN